MTGADAPKRALVIGGTSDIGRAIAAAYLDLGWSVTITGRDMEAVERELRDLATRHDGATVETRHLDILETASFDGFVDGLPGRVDTAICVVGMLGDQERAQTDADHATQVMRTNYEGPALLSETLAARMAEDGGGLIVGISSVAGDRGRATNYVYGAAKAGFTAHLSGLRNRFAATALRVTTVKPGFVRTRMTADMDLPGPLTATPAEVARRVVALERRPADVIHVL
ncbi:MAG: SDR family oxidoreductase, partial [Pseudomonadota bacterium]